MPDRLVALPRAVASPWYVEDFFSDPDTTPLANHAPDVDIVGGWWTELVGSWAISSNQARVDAVVAQDEFATIDSGRADVLVIADVTLTNDGAGDHNVGLVFRIDAANDWWLFWQDINDGNLRLGKFVLGSFTSVGSKSFVWPSGATKEMKVKLSGNSIECFVDGVLEHSTVDSHNVGTTVHGMYSNGTITQRHDNFRIGRVLR